MMKSDLAALIDAFDRLAAADFAMGAEWQVVHDICQAHEGVQPFDWGHALCHRIEGDDWNAGYWYRRAGKTVANEAVADEWAAMRAEIST
ncbi:hypothetical protein N7E02_23680 [Aliirhizobium terrae]|uniref:hypothetical protein n=1 Tax=Terrirhizobium terrae TaxID=2926709 RepID=UPI002575650D|nr:hypothetical protein [Rhizobium sp. CC-CFT758]WJH42303.1 hypothetical protein N7E02_23680 [Rhizobium sp. CC-CFT758]